MNIEAVLPNFLGFDLVRCYLGTRLSLTFPQLDMFFFALFLLSYRFTELSRL